MVDQEVADILQEIRNRVRAGGDPSQSTPAPGSNGTPKEEIAEPVTPNVAQRQNSYASLSTMARAWDRLPPVVSDRSGTSARLELWVKSKLKTALRWFTWEQVNFNAATHHTFLELIDSLTTHGQELLRLQNQLKSEIRDQLNAERREQKQQLDSQRAELLREIEARRMQLDHQQASLNSQQLEFRQLQSQVTARLTELDAEQKRFADQQLEARAAAQSQLALLVKEFRERDERLLDEQRVCFKQLSLELSESQVLEDRARREIESRLTKLEGKD